MRKVHVDQVLVAAQLRGVVPPDHLVVVRCDPVVKRAGRHVQYPVIGRGILKDILVGGCQGEQILLIRLRYKVAVVQVSFVHPPHIHQAEQQERGYKPLRFYFFLEEQPNQCSPDQDDQKAAPRVSREECHPNIGQIGNERLQVTRGQCLPEHLHLGGRDKRRKEELRREREQQRDTARHT